MTKSLNNRRHESKSYCICFSTIPQVFYRAMKRALFRLLKLRGRHMYCKASHAAFTSKQGNISKQLWGSIVCGKFSQPRIWPWLFTSVRSCLWSNSISARPEQMWEACVQRSWCHGAHNFLCFTGRVMTSAIYMNTLSGSMANANHQ